MKVLQRGTRRLERLMVFRASVLLPLRREDPVEQRLRGVAALWWPEGEHVLDHVEGKLLGDLAEQRGFGEGGPLVLQSPLTPHVVLGGSGSSSSSSSSSPPSSSPPPSSSSPCRPGPLWGSGPRP